MDLDSEHPPFLAQVRAELAGLTEAGHLRRRPLIEGPDRRAIIVLADGRRRKMVNWASNDYLGSAWNLKNRNAATRAMRTYGAGSGAARLLAGGLRCHRRLEERLAHWLGSEEVLVTSTGYQANLAALGALAGPGDWVVLDRLCHASLYDGALLSGARRLRFAHNDPADLDRVLARASGVRRVLVAVESVYSMDGDEAPLHELAEVCRRRGAVLLVDEAHALGVYGPGGRGGCAAAGITPDLLVGTCSKSLGAQGGFLAGHREVIELVVNRGRAFIYTTAPCPAAMGAAIASLDRLWAEPDLGQALLARAQSLRQALQAAGWNTGTGRGPIIPILVGDAAAAVDLATSLAANGHHAPAIRPPTVPPGSSRLRLTVTLAHKMVDLRRLAAAMERLRR